LAGFVGLNGTSSSKPSNRLAKSFTTRRSGLSGSFSTVTAELNKTAFEII
jgi:hypothetical protein